VNAALDDLEAIENITEHNINDKKTEKPKRAWGRAKPLPPGEKSTPYEASKGAIKRHLKNKYTQLSLWLPQSMVKDFSAACKAFGVTQVSVLKPIMLDAIKRANQKAGGKAIEPLFPIEMAKKMIDEIEMQFDAKINSSREIDAHSENNVISDEWGAE